jgi:hypothetical protein
MNTNLGGKKPHKTKSHRKIITIQEWANLLGVSRPSIYKYLEEYKKEGTTYDPTDIYSILAFYRYIIFTCIIDEKWIVQWIASKKEKLL